MPVPATGGRLARIAVIANTSQRRLRGRKIRRHDRKEGYAEAMYPVFVILGGCVGRD